MIKLRKKTTNWRKN